MSELAALIPHAGNMCLLDRVVACSADEIECAARSQNSPDHPLRRGGQLSALHLVEYAAQAAAVHGAMQAGGIQRGMLAALREVHLHVVRVDDIDTELRVHATRRLSQASGSLYDFRVEAGGRPLCAGRVAIAFV